MTAVKPNEEISFLSKETLGGLLLMMGALAALIISNSPLYGTYKAFLDIPVAICQRRTKNAPVGRSKNASLV